MIAFRFIYELWQKERADILNVTMQDDYVPVLLLWLIINNNVVKEFWRKAASPFYHPLQRRIGFFRRSDLDRRLIRVSLRSHESAPKRHLDRFSRFTKRKNVTNGHTDTPHYSVCSNRPHLTHWVHATQPSNNNKIIMSFGISTVNSSSRLLCGWVCKVFVALCCNLHGTNKCSPKDVLCEVMLSVAIIS